LETKPKAADAQFTIRDYRASDFQRLWEIDQLCFPPGIAYNQMELSSFIMGRNTIALVAEFQQPGFLRRPEGGDSPPIAGFAVADHRARTGRILTLDVLPEMRRSGLGSRLMRECEHRLRSAGCKEIYLETAVNNEAAARLYQKMEYEILRTIPDYYSSHGLDAFVMRKRL
jgi:[ribosomal protein S18]-alanine N-acetyltransferase